MEDADRSTAVVIEALGDDIDRCRVALEDCIDRNRPQPEFDFLKRQLVRAVFAYIEAVTFSAKTSSAWICMERGIPITPTERYLATDTEYDLNDKGAVIECRARIPLASNVRFAITLHERAHVVNIPFDPKHSWWNALKIAVRVRDRLTHPKMPSDLDLTDDELYAVVEAMKGYEEYLLQKKTVRKGEHGRHAV